MLVIATSSFRAARTARAQRAMETHTLFREVNERIERITDTFQLVNPTIHFVCECANTTCTEQISLTRDEYEGLRRRPGHFAVVAADRHVWSDVERVVENVTRYWVVEKLTVGEARGADTAPAGENR